MENNNRNILVSETSVSNVDAAFSEALENSSSENTSTTQTTIIPPIIADNFIDESTSRFSGAIWFDKIQKQNVLIAGVGGIGSNTAYLISRMHPNKLQLYDNDKVDNVNMSGQFFTCADLERFKVDAIANHLQKFSHFFDTYSFRERVTEKTYLPPIVICGFDNMEARKITFYNWLTTLEGLTEAQKKKYLFIDGRLAAEKLQVFCMTGDDTYNQDLYKRDWLFSEEEAEHAVCSYKQTSYCAMLIASIICNLFVNFCANMCEPLINRDLPFFTEYDASTMYFKTQS